jgi:DNA-binding response OmpR family regulator
VAHILVIDDEPNICEILTKILERDGHSVDTAGDGKVGMALFECNSYDLVITDIVMPERDGLEVIRALAGKLPRTKLIAITGGTPRLDRDYLLSMAKVMRVDRVFSKPIDFELLKNGVNELLAQ